MWCGGTNMRCGWDPVQIFAAPVDTSSLLSHCTVGMDQKAISKIGRNTSFLRHVHQYCLKNTHTANLLNCLLEIYAIVSSFTANLCHLIASR